MKNTPFAAHVKGPYRAVLNVTEGRYVAPKLLLPKPVPARRALAGTTTEGDPRLDRT